MDLPKTVAGLTANPDNPRTITPEAAAGLGFSMESFGDLSILNFCVRSGHLVCGHQRTSQLPPDAQIVNVREETDPTGQVARGEIVVDGVTWSVRFVDWDEHKEMAANIAANSPTLGGSFTESIIPILEDLKIEVPELVGPLLFEELRIDLDGQLSDAPASTKRPDPDKEPEWPEVTEVKEGDVYGLGRHRVMCGSSLNPAHVYKLTSGARLRLCITDPPFDMRSHEQARAILAAGSSVFAVLGSGQTWFQLVAMPEFKLRFDAVITYGGQVRQLAMNTLPKTHNRLAVVEVEELEQIQDHENVGILTSDDKLGWRAAAFCKRLGTGSTVIDLGNQAHVDKHKHKHKHQKPVRFWQAIMAGFENDTTVYDPFIGSGAIVIAAELEGRAVFGMELDPINIQMVLDRWKAFTGIDAARLD